MPAEYCLVVVLDNSLGTVGGGLNFGGTGCKSFRVVFNTYVERAHLADEMVVARDKVVIEHVHVRFQRARCLLCSASTVFCKSLISCSRIWWVRFTALTVSRTTNVLLQFVHPHLPRYGCGVCQFKISRLSQPDTSFPNFICPNPFCFCVFGLTA